MPTFAVLQDDLADLYNIVMHLSKLLYQFHRHQVHTGK